MTFQEEITDLIVVAQDALGLPASATVTVVPFEGRGSDRSFFRVRWSSTDSAILIRYSPNRVENMYYAEIGLFLRDIGVAVPTILFHDPARCLIVAEDLGETDLWSLRDTAWETRRALYQKTLSVTQRLHSFPEKELLSRHLRLMPGFDLEHYRWKRDYFRINFIETLCGLSLDSALAKELEMELSSLAHRLHTCKRALLHRDLQSQNVMIKDGEPFLIDFQGMRFGDPLYDIGSLLCDPYVTFSNDEREELLSFYYGLGNQEIDWPSFRMHFWEASAQRLMQALGAFGFLGLKKGLMTYLEHVPVGLRTLREAAFKVPTLPRLRHVLEACEEAIVQGTQPAGTSP